MKKLLCKLFDRTFWKFILVGVANTLFGTAIMFLFYNVLHCSYWISSASNYFFGSILSYILNRKFTFRSDRKTAATLPRFIAHIAVCYLLAYGIAKPAVRAPIFFPAAHSRCRKMSPCWSGCACLSA